MADEKAAKRKRLHAKVVEEIFSTEETYLEDLKIIKEHVVTPILQLYEQGLQLKGDSLPILNTIEMMECVNSDLLKELQDAKKAAGNDIDKMMIGQCFIKQAGCFGVYELYCCRSTTATNMILRTAKRSSKLAKLIQGLLDNEDAKRLGLQGLLIKPFQRVTKYPLLFRELTKLTDENHVDYQNRIKAMAVLEGIVQKINKAKGQRDGMSVVSSVIQNIGSLPDELKLVPNHRTMVKQGILTKSKQGRKEAVEDERMFYLFSDVLVYCRMRPLAKDSYRGHIFLNQILVQKGEENSNKFLLSRADKKKTWVVTARSAAVKNDWVEVLQNTLDEYAKLKGTENEALRTLNSLTSCAANLSTGSRRPASRREKEEEEDAEDADGDEEDHELPLKHENGKYNFGNIAITMFGPEGVEIKDRTYMLKTWKQCFVGNEAVDWLVKQLDIPRENAVLVGKEMQKLGHFRHVSNKSSEFQDKNLFYSGSDSRCLNTIILWEHPARDAVQVSIDLLTQITTLYSAYADVFKKFGVQAMGIVSLTPEFEKFKEDTCELQQASLDGLNDFQLTAFFTNLFNTLCLHSYLVYWKEMKETSGTMLSRMSLFKKTKYKIGTMYYSMFSMEHGALRGNSHTPQERLYAAMIPKFRKSDARYKYIVKKQTPYISFGLNYGTKSSPSIKIYNASDVEGQLKQQAKEYLKELPEIEDTKKGGKLLSLPKVLQWYYKDFGLSEDSMVSNLFDYFPSGLQSDLPSFLRNKKRKIRYMEYDWSYMYPL